MFLWCFKIFGKFSEVFGNLAIFSLVKIWKISYSGPGCTVIWILWVVYFPVKRCCPYNKKNYYAQEHIMNNWCWNPQNIYKRTFSLSLKVKHSCKEKVNRRIYFANHFSVIFRIGPCVSPRRHPQLAVGVNIHVPSQVTSVLVQVASRISGLNLWKRSASMVRVTTWVATCTNTLFNRNQYQVVIKQWSTHPKLTRICHRL